MVRCWQFTPDRNDDSQRKIKRLYLVTATTATLAFNPNAASAERIRKLVELRDTTRALIDAQLQDLSDKEIHHLQAQLNRQYDAFRSKHGLINSRSAELSFRDDSSYYLLCSLENVDEKGNFISKSDMFTKRTIRSAQI